MLTKKLTIAGSLLVAGMALAWMPTPKQDKKKLDESIARGKEIYAELCITCHMVDGKGMPGAFPPLTKSTYFAGKPAKAIYPIKYGMTTPTVVNGTTYSTPMPNPNLSNEEIADVTTYIMNSFGNKGKLVTVKDVEAVKEVKQ
jgi:mono/diheme cytochrome c family protein